MICPNCGGEYADWAIKCPYCGSTNDEANEAEYLRHLEELRRRLDHVDEESEAYYSKGINSMLKRILILVGVLVMLAVVMIASAFLFIGKMENKSEKKAMAQHEWEKTEFPKLEEMYEKGDFDGILEEKNRLYTEGSQYSLISWSHYDFCLDYYERYVWLIKVRDYLATEEEPSAYMVGEGIYSSMYLTFEASEEKLSELIKNYREYKKYGVTEEEADKIREYREEAKIFLTESMGWSQDEIEAMYEKLYKDGFLSSRRCFEVGEELAEKMKGK